jgi:serine/alanine adding enzyme
MSIRIVNSLDEIIWREFISNHPHANIFHTPEMYSVFSRAQGHRPSIWAAVEGNDHPLALLLPVKVTLRNGVLYPWTTRAVAYGGILCNRENSSDEALQRLLKEYSGNAHGNFLFTELRNMSPSGDFQRTLSRYNFDYEDHLDYLVNLEQPEESLWRGLSKSCRQRIRIAKSKGTIIEEVADQNQLLVAYQFLQRLYLRIKVPLAPFSLFKAAYEICGPAGMCKIFLARVGDNYIGSAFNLMYYGKILAWYSACDRAFSAYNPGELLKWHVFQWGKTHGYRVFAFGGAGKPNEAYGPRDFKAKFGGELVNYGRNTCVHSPLRYRISKTVYSLTRNFSIFG